ncbi:type I pullulanase [Bombiscardovia nodaiensis]|uniref:Type I pullulanase n=1 Tax=Bombiscardovia nodaiensis TaxID=2932181 RepID=A0ABM8B7S5_9BIFI|nr:type I pullulanase [Bombiscardovia nodaiensis]
MQVRLFADGSSASQPIRILSLNPGENGSWKCELPERLAGLYYDYLICDDQGERTTPDPWAKASGVNGTRSMVVDLEQTNPIGWAQDQSPQVDLASSVIWETHVQDFSWDEQATFPREHRGKYQALTDRGVGLVTGDGGTFPVGIDYLRQLGVTHVEIMPFYDFGSVDEAAGQGYNWGYDPVAFNLPDGSYSTDPYDGACRIREAKAMIASLHQAGFRVIMDVVYNHMYRADNAFERVVPGYFCRRDQRGQLTNASGCGNDMASERPMFSRFIVDSLVYWAQEYHIDGFRFDLMGLIDVDTMNRARAALDGLPGGRDILMFGEPWSADPSQAPQDVPLADKDGAQYLDSRIGWFCDRGRDAIKGSTWKPKQAGFASGRAPSCGLEVARAMDAWRGEHSFGPQPGQLIQYVSSHDDLTLWDKLCMSMRQEPTRDDFLARKEVEDLLAANAIAAGLVFTSAGIPFMLGGEEFARTKLGCGNSFDASPELNQLDWQRASRMQPLVSWYQQLINLRKTHHELFDARRSVMPSDDFMLAVSVGNVLVGANPTDNMGHVNLPAGQSASSWHLLLDSYQTLFGRRQGSKVLPGRGQEDSNELLLEPQSCMIWQLEQ